MATGPKVNMPKPSKKKIQSKDTSYWLEKISLQLERLVICNEKRLTGQVFPDFDSKKELKNKES